MDESKRYKLGIEFVINTKQLDELSSAVSKVTDAINAKLNSVGKDFEENFSKDVEKVAKDTAKAIEKLDNATTKAAEKQKQLTGRTINLSSSFDKLNESALKSEKGFEKGTLIWARFNEETEQLTQSIKLVDGSIVKIKGQFDALNGKLEDVRQTTQKTHRDLKSSAISWTEAIRIAITRTIQWAVAMTGVYGTIRQIRNAIAIFAEVESGISVLKRVTTDVNANLSTWKIGRSGLV